MDYINTIETIPFVPEVIMPVEQKAEKHFITANTIAGNLSEMKEHHLIPVFSKDNEPTISHTAVSYTHLTLPTKRIV